MFPDMQTTDGSELWIQMFTKTDIKILKAHIMMF